MRSSPARPFRASLVRCASAAVLALLVAACQDTTTEPKITAPETNLSSKQSTGGPSRGAATSPYACFTSIATPGGQHAYRYGRLNLGFPKSAIAPNGETMRYRFRAYGKGGQVLALANCVIPRTVPAVEQMNRRFGMSPRAGLPEDGGELDVSITSECGGTGQEPCNMGQLPGVEGGGSACSNEDWVRDDSGVCWPPSSGDGDGSGSGGSTGGEGGTGGGTDPCYSCDPDSTPVLSCSSSVVRGTQVTCSVTVPNGSSPSVTEWNFDDGAGRVITASGGSTTWSGTAAVGGRVSAIVNSSMVLYSSFAVTDRGWSWASRGVTTQSDNTGPSCWVGTPSIGISDAWNQGLHASDPCRADDRFIQPDSYGAADAYGPTDGFEIQPVSSGPNKGVIYVASANLSIKRKSAINPGRFATADKIELAGWNRGKCSLERANWYEFNRCMGVDVDDLLAGLLAHEGMGRNGGYGHTSAAKYYAEKAENDPFILLDGIVSNAGESRDAFRARTRDEFYVRADRVERGAQPNASAGGITGGNWSGNVYYLNPSTLVFELTHHSF